MSDNALKNLITIRNQIKLDVDNAKNDLRISQDCVTNLPESTPAHVIKFYYATLRYAEDRLAYTQACLEEFYKHHPEVKEDDEDGMCSN